MPFQARLWTALLIATTATPALAQEPVATLLADHYEEYSGPRPLAAGDGAIIGLQVLGGTPTAAGDLSLYIRNRSGDRFDICLQVTSADGFYEAANEYALPASAPGTYVRIPVDAKKPLGTNRPDLYRSATAQTLALRASEGPCRDENPRILPVVIGHPPQSSDVADLSIAVRSGYHRSEIAFQNKRTAAVPCNLFDPGRTEDVSDNGFDSLCELRLPDRPGAIAFQLQSYSYGEPKKEVVQYLLL